MVVRREYRRVAVVADADADSSLAGTRGTSRKRGLSQAAGLAGCLLLGLVAPALLLKPLVAPAVVTVAGELGPQSSASSQAWFVAVCAAMAAVPGFPVLSLVSLLGGMLPFTHALALAVSTRLLAASFCFAAGWALRDSVRPQERGSRWAWLATLERMTRTRPWRTSLLSRFIMLPEQAKNAALGALCVRFHVFFCTAATGDLLSTFFALVVGSLSHANRDEHAELLKVCLTMGGMACSLLLMTMASLYAKRLHTRVESERDAEREPVAAATKPFGGARRRGRAASLCAASAHAAGIQSSVHGGSANKGQVRRHSLLHNLV